MTTQRISENHDSNGKAFIQALRDRIGWPHHLTAYTEATVDDSNEVTYWGIAFGSTLRRLAFSDSTDTVAPSVVVEQITMPQGLADKAGFSTFQQTVEHYGDPAHETLDHEWFTQVETATEDIDDLVNEAAEQLEMVLKQHLGTSQQ